MSPDNELRNAVAAELAALTAHGGPAGTKSPRATYQQFADSPSRAQMRRDIITGYLADELAPSAGVRKAIITAGVPGAGKSTAVHTILGPEASQYRHVDADVIKDALLDHAVATGLYADLLGRRLADDKPVAPRELAALVHNESTQISDTVRRHVLTSGEPIVIEGTLTWPGLVDTLLTELQDARLHPRPGDPGRGTRTCRARTSLGSMVAGAPRRRRPARWAVHPARRHRQLLQVRRDQRVPCQRRDACPQCRRLQPHSRAGNVDVSVM